MKIEHKDFDRYVKHIRKLFPEYLEMEAIFKDGKVKWVRIKHNSEFEPKEPIKKKKKTKKRKTLSLLEHDGENLREHILKRDGYRCSVCGMISDLEIHHKKYVSKGGDNNPDNLITLCEICHYKIHINEPISNLMKSRLKKKGMLL